MSWQDRCAIVIELLERHFPEVRYQLTFRKDGGVWNMYAEARRNDHGPHQGTTLTFVGPVHSNTPEALPMLLLEKSRERILSWQEDGMMKIQERAGELAEARAELDRRLGANVGLEVLAKQLKDE